MTAAELAARLDGRRNGSGWPARCPAHEDRHGSLSIGEGHDGRVLLKCHAGCDLSAILAKLSLREADLFPKRDVAAAAVDRLAGTRGAAAHVQEQQAPHAAARWDPCGT